MKKPIIIFYLVLSFIFLFTKTRAQNLEKFLRDDLDNYVNSGMEMWQIPAVAVCVVKDGKVLVSKGYGVCEMGKPEKVNENTLFMIGSNSKVFTATLLVMLEDEQKCSLNDKVQKWLPDFKMKDSWVAKELNLTDILCHRIGMETFQGDFMYWTSNLTPKQVIEKFGTLTPVYPFRTKWGYTNAGFVIAGECIKSISGKSWEELLKEKIFSPLNMNRSLPLAVNLTKAENVAVPYTMVERKLQRIPFGIIDNLAPAGSIGSSVNDMSHWVLALLDSGKFENKNVIPYSVIHKTRTPQSIIGRNRHLFNKTHFSLYGLGLDLEDYERKEIVSHTGGVNGYVTSVTFIPEEKFGVVVLTNTDQNRFYQALKWEIVDAALNLPSRNYSSVFFKRTKQFREKEAEELNLWRDSVKMNLKNEFPLNEYAAKYENESYGFIQITEDGKNLKMSFEHHPDMTGKMEYIGNNRFLCTYSDPEFGIKIIPFEKKENKIYSFTLSVADFIEFTTYQFIKK